MINQTELQEALYNRHKVTKYKSQKISEKTLEKLNSFISEINSESDLNFSININDSMCMGFFFKHFASKNACNYVVLTGDSDNLEEKVGYYGMKFMLYAQSLGLNTWWISDTYNKKYISEKYPNKHIVGIIVFGYGMNNGTPHKSKTMSEVSSYTGNTPEWFKNGVSACLQAPTAMNKQAFFVKGNKNKIVLECSSNKKYCKIDKGILKYSFELGAGIGEYSFE
ncbi:nitroreductase family protein [Butyrivibrio sp. M55]|uniref:nitroreductase family protein n=1 Tax=Butyrivibrio sp. M55 TaxID=1855323 RepID=UPI0008ECEEAA|nr:nitroreductase family protein [Butyrivibrio sp. M55]SFU45493.1 Putative TM nitroreductase [Butyrivibrio sp. M55]